MKWIALIILVLVSKAILISQGVGIGTTTPLTKLHIQGGGFLIDGSTGDAPVSGPGRRLMWIPSKGAFRAGEVYGNEWNQDSIGFFSMVMGESCVAKGDYSVALGASTRATGFNSTALGISNIASGLHSTAFGTYNHATGYISTAWGEQCHANGSLSTAWGDFTEAPGTLSTAFGHTTTAIGDMSTSSGWQTIAKSFSGTVIGTYNDSTSAASTFQVNPNNRLFQIGNGTNYNARSNAMTVLQNGNVGIGSLTPVSRLQVTNGAVLFDGSTGNAPVSGPGRRFMWIPSKGAFRAGEVYGNEWNQDSIGYFSVVMGESCVAKGDYSVALGASTRATGFNSTALGISNIASGLHSTVFGTYNHATGYISTAWGEQCHASGALSTAWGDFTEAPGTLSTAFGHTTTAIGDMSTSSGWQTIAKSFSGTVIGTYNDSTSAASTFQVNPNNRLFQIGNGTNYNARSNAMTVLQNGNVGIGVIVPTNLLDVGGRMRVRYGASNTAGIFFNKSDNSSEAGFVGMYADDYIGLYGAGVGWAFLMNTITGNVGIGAAAPTEKLNVIGNGLFTGTVTASCGVLVCSDIRYKKNIIPVSNALTSLQFLHGIYYHWDKEKFTDKAFTDERQIGFSAQELEKVYPEMVHTDANGYKTVDYSRLTPVLVEAIKEQQFHIQEQDMKIDMLIRELETIKNLFLQTER